MQKHWKKIVIAVVALAVVVVAGSFIYAKIINDAPAKTTKQDAIDVTQTTAAGDATSAPEGGGTGTGATDSPTVPAATGSESAATGEVDGDWSIGSGSTVNYRVTESINGFDTEGVGSTESVSGSLTIAGTSVTSGQFTVDMTTFKSNESRRDGQFNGRIMAVDEFPTATFVLTDPIEFGSIPGPGETVTATATGDLTLRGTTKSVTFEVNAAYDNDIIGVQGAIPVLFADFGIPNPSFATVSTEDHGLLEFVLAFTRS